MYISGRSNYSCEAIGCRYANMGAFTGKRDTDSLCSSRPLAFVRQGRVRIKANKRLLHDNHVLCLILIHIWKDLYN